MSQAEADSCQLAPVTAALHLGDKFVGAENVARLVPATASVARWALLSKGVYEMKVLGWKSIPILDGQCGCVFRFLDKCPFKSKSDS